MTDKNLEKDDKHREAQQKVIAEKKFDFIEKSKPEDRIDGDVDGERASRGQMTRDNVNPAIPSAKPGEGGIVDPKSLGMESQAGVAPPKRIEDAKAAPKEGEEVLGSPASINEPPGSDVTPDAPPPEGQAKAKQQPARQAAASGQGHDPDDLEEEIEEAEDDDEVDVRHGGKKKKK